MWTDADIAVRNAEVFGAKPEPTAGAKRNKFGARKKEVDGIVFASSAEAKRYVELKAMEQTGLIAMLKLQPRFLLQEAFRDGAGKAHRKAEYLADFQYVDGHAQTVVEDVKGVATEAFKLKWKLAVKRYPECEFRIVGTRGPVRGKRRG